MPDYSDLLTPLPKSETALHDEAMNPTTTPGDYSALLAPLPAPKVSPTGQTQEPMSGWQSGFKVLTDKLTTGGAAFGKGPAGFLLVGGSDMASADQLVNETALAEAQKHREDFVNQNAYMNLFKLRDLPWEDKNNPEVFNAIDIPGMAIESIPTIGATVGVGWTGGAMAGAVFGTEAAIGLGAATLAFNPVVVGSVAAGALVAGALMMGSHVYDQMKRGVPREHAIIGGIVSGAIGGVATSVGLGALGHLLPSAAQVVFNNGGFRKSVGELAITLAKAAGIDAAGGFVQSSVDASLKYIETHITKVDKPVTLAEVLTEVAGGTASSIVTSPIIGSVTGGLGVAAGKRALTRHAEMHEAIKAHIARMEKLEVALAEMEAQEKAKRDAVTQEKIVTQQTKARKELKGFVSLEIVPDVQTAHQNLEDAQTEHAQHKTKQTAAAVKQAKVELQQAKFEAHVNRLEEALTDPDLLANVKAEREALEQRLQVLQGQRDIAQAPSEKKVLDGIISRVREELQQVKALEGLGVPELVRARVEEMKAEVQAHLDQTRNEAARATLEHRMATRSKAIDALRAGISEHKEAARSNKEDVAAEVPEVAAANEGKFVSTELSPASKRAFTRQLPNIPDEVLLAMVTNPNHNYEQAVQARNELLRRKGLTGKAEHSEADTAHKRDRLAQLKEQQELDQLILGMLEAGELGEGDIKSLAPEAPSARLKGLAELAQRKIEQASKMSGAEQKKLMKSAKKLLDAVVDFSRLPDKDKNTLKAKYATADLKTLQDGLEHLVGEINDLFEQRRLEAARKDLDKLVDSTKIDSTTASKFPEVEGQIEHVKQFVKDPDAVEAFLEEVENKETLTEEEMAIVELTNLFPDEVEKLSAAQIEAIIDTLVTLKETGKAEALRRTQERRERQKFKLGVLEQRMTRRKQQKPGIKALIEKILDDKVAAEVTSWRGLMTMITQFGEANDLSDIFDVKSALSEMHKIRIYWENRFVEKLEASGVDKRRWQKFNIDANKKISGELTYRRIESLEDGTQLERTEHLEQPNGEAYTYWELIQIRNYLLDEDLDAKSRFTQGNHFSYPGQVQPHRSTLEVVEDHLDAHLKDWRTVGDTMREIYTPDEFGAVVNETIERRYGRSMPRNWSYGGQLLTEAGGGQSRESFRRMSNRPGSTRARQGGNKRVLIKSAIRNLESHIAQYAREHAMFELEQDLPAIFKQNQAVRDAISRNIGDNTLAVIDRYIDDVVYGQQEQMSSAEKIIAHLGDALYSTFLGARPEQAAKQMTGAIQALQFVGPEAMLDAYAYMLADPAGATDLMNRSGLLQARKLGRPASTDPGIVGKIKRFNDSLSLSVKVGDEYGTYGAAFPVLLDTLRRTGSEVEALKAFETAFDTTQSSTSVDERPNLFRGNVMLRMLAFMAQEPTRQVESIFTAGRKWRAGKATFADLARVATTTYLGALLYNLVGYMVIYPFLTDDQREQKLNYILDVAPLGPFAGVAVLGQVLSSGAVMFWRPVFNQNVKSYEPELLPGNVFKDLLNLQKAATKVATEGGDAKDYWTAILYAGRVIGDTTGIPVNSLILNKIEPLLGVKEQR